MTSPVEVARSLLFVPGSRPDRFGKAAAASADEIVVDLEDAVTDADKEAARTSVRAWLADGGHGTVRVNSGGAELARDLDALRGVPGLRGVVVPKAEDPGLLTAVATRLGVPVLALLETAAGVAAARAVAGADGVARLAIGTIDLALDLGAEETWESLLLARCELVLASRLAGLPGPVDGVATAIGDARSLAEATSRARALGFTGKLCVHPAQVQVVHDAFRPSATEVSWAEDVVAAMTTSGSAGRVRGEMVDRPVLTRAEQVLSRQARYGTRSTRRAD